MRVRRGQLLDATATLQTDLERRICEGFWPRIYRWLVTDRTLRAKFILATAGRAKLSRVERQER
jgi:hypothetical protein